MISFTVPGIPRPEGSTKAFVVGGRARITHDNPKLRSWRADVRCEALRAFTGPLMACPVVVTAFFVFPRPKGHYGTGRNADIVRASAPAYPATKPDLDKLARGLNDALTGAIWRDDAQVVHLIVGKQYGERPETHITVQEAKR